MRGAQCDGDRAGATHEHSGPRVYPGLDAASSAADRCLGARRRARDRRSSKHGSMKRSRSGTEPHWTGCSRTPFSGPTRSMDGSIPVRSSWIKRHEVWDSRGNARSRARSTPPLPCTDSAAIRTARVRIRFKDGTRETWMRQNRVFVRDGDQWKLASAQGTRMYRRPGDDAGDIPTLRRQIRHRHETVATPRLGRRRAARDLSQRRAQSSLPESPTEEAVQGPDHFRFVLNEGGRPVAVLLLRGEQQVWRGERVE